MEARNQNKRWSRALNLLVVAGLLAALIFLVDLPSVGSVLAGVSKSSVVLALIVATLDRILMTYKWRQLLAAIGAKLRFITALRIHYQSLVSGRIIPAPLGADVLRVYLATKVGIAYEAAISSIVIEKLVAMLASVVLAITGLLLLSNYFPEGARLNVFLVIAAASLVTGIGAFTILMMARAHRLGGTVLGWLDARGVLPKKLGRLLQKTSSSLLLFRNRAMALAINGVLALLEHCTQVLKLVVLAIGLGLSMPAISIGAIAAVALFVRRIGGIVEAWGLGEGSAIVTLVLLGIDAELAVALLIANFAVSTIAVAPGVIFYYTHPVLRPREVSKEERAKG